jgi:hypothetical protein
LKTLGLHLAVMCVLNTRELHLAVICFFLTPWDSTCSTSVYWMGQ